MFPASSSAPIAALALLAVVGLAAFDVAPILVLSFMAAAVILLTRCVDPDEAFDFVEARLESPLARRVTSVAVLIIGWLYIVPQLHGAGITLQVVADLPPWTGAAVVAALKSQGIDLGQLLGAAPGETVVVDE